MHVCAYQYVYLSGYMRNRRVKGGRPKEAKRQVSTRNKIWNSVFVTSLSFFVFAVVVWSQISSHLVSNCSDIKNARRLK